MEKSEKNENNIENRDELPVNFPNIEQAVLPVSNFSRRRFPDVVEDIIKDLRVKRERTKVSRFVEFSHFTEYSRL